MARRDQNKIDSIPAALMDKTMSLVKDAGGIQRDALLSLASAHLQTWAMCALIDGFDEAKALFELQTAMQMAFPDAWRNAIMIRDSFKMMN